MRLRERLSIVQATALIPLLLESNVAVVVLIIRVPTVCLNLGSSSSTDGGAAASYRQQRSHLNNPWWHSQHPDYVMLWARGWGNIKCSDQSHLFTIEPNGRSCVHILIVFEPVEHSGLASRVQPNHGTVVGAKVGDVVGQRRYRILTQSATHCEEVTELNATIFFFKKNSCVFPEITSRPKTKMPIFKTHHRAIWSRRDLGWNCSWTDLSVGTRTDRQTDRRSQCAIWK